jgi:hypothetical protein
MFLTGLSLTRVLTAEQLKSGKGNSRIAERSGALHKFEHYVFLSDRHHGILRLE